MDPRRARSGAEPTVAVVSGPHVEDRGWARRIAAALRRFRTPRALVRRGLARRVADVEVATAPRALPQVDAVVPVCSTRSAETGAFGPALGEARTSAAAPTVLPLVVSGDDSVVARSLGSDDERRAAPLSADVRPVEGRSPGARWRTAVLRLLAAVFDCEFDELRRRDRARRVSRARAAVAAAAAAAACATGLAVYTAGARGTAEEQARAAAASAERATARRDASLLALREAVAGLAPGALDPTGESQRVALAAAAVGHLDELVGVAPDATPAARTALVRATRRLGDSRAAAGDDDGALAAYGDALAAAARAPPVDAFAHAREAAVAAARIGDLVLGVPYRDGPTTTWTIDPLSDHGGPGSGVAYAGPWFDRGCLELLWHSSAIAYDRIEFGRAAELYRRARGLLAPYRAGPDAVRARLDDAWLAARLADVAHFTGDLAALGAARADVDDALAHVRAAASVSDATRREADVIAARAASAAGALFRELGRDDEARAAFRAARERLAALDDPAVPDPVADVRRSPDEPDDDASAGVPAATPAAARFHAAAFLDRPDFVGAADVGDRLHWSAITTRWADAESSVWWPLTPPPPPAVPLVDRWYPDGPPRWRSRSAWAALRAGLAQSEVLALLGAPRQRARKPSGATWLYQAPCGARAEFDRDGRLASWRAPERFADDGVPR